MFQNIVKKIDSSVSSIHLLKSNTMLYVLLLIALTNMYSYVMTDSHIYVAFMLIIGFLTSFFSKNMIVILFLSVVIPNIIRYSSEYQPREGFTGTETEDSLVDAGVNENDLKEVMDMSKSNDPESKTKLKMKMNKVTQNMGSMKTKINNALTTADKIKDEEKKKKVKDILHKQKSMIDTLSGMGSSFEDMMDDLMTNFPKMDEHDYDK